MNHEYVVTLRDIETNEVHEVQTRGRNAVAAKQMAKRKLRRRFITENVERAE